MNQFLQEILKGIGTGKDEVGSIKQVIQKERECGESFTEWQLGFTPKEHREMMDRQEWRDWQERQRKDDRGWRIKEIAILVLMTGGFIVLGALIGRGSIP